MRSVSFPQYLLCFLSITSGTASGQSAPLGEPVVFQAPEHEESGAGTRTPPPVHFQPSPNILQVTETGPEFENSRISDLAIEDVDRDGCRDIVVAWWANHATDFNAHQRFLTIFYGDCIGNFSRGTQINLYVRDLANQQRSIFANGTAAMALGDYDGDGDKDIAVTANFGDEIWFIENLGNRLYTPRFKHVFIINTAGNFMTPPRAVAGDFDGDGRDDLAYIIDPVQRFNFVTIAFWKTSSSLLNISRRTWEGADPGFVVSYTRGLDVADFNNDGKADLVFTGSQSVGEELMPAVSLIWYGFNSGSQLFSTAVEFPTFICSDVAAVKHPSLCDPGLAFSDRDGYRFASWNSTCGTGVDYAFGENEDGFSTTSTDRGMAIVAADVNEDGLPDIVTRQKTGNPTDCTRVEIALAGAPGNGWTRLPETTLESCGFDDTEFDQILRPRNLAVGNLFWNSAPEIIAGFGPTIDGKSGRSRLEIAIWPNSCRGDVNHDGVTDVADLTALMSAFGCAGPGFIPDADLNRSGCIDLADLTLILADFGCSCCGQ